MLITAGCSLAEDITPPPGYRSPVPVTAAPTVVAFPDVPPNPLAGRNIYTEKCAACHGEEGLGDGEQAGQLPNMPSALGSLEVNALAVPSNWFQIVSNGNLDRFMPPFAGSLNERQRWDVVAYALSLAASPAELGRAEVLYEQECAGCHGPEGRGDGPEAAGAGAPVPNWKDPRRLSAWSSQSLAETIAQGAPPAMPAYGATLGESELWALAHYVRALTFEQAGPQSDATAAPTDAAATPGPGTATPAAGTADPGAEAALPTQNWDTFSISGQVANGSGAALPSSLQVQLQAFDGMQPVYETVTAMQANGAYRFEDVPYADGRAYMVLVDYDGMVFNSDILHGADVPLGGDAELPVTIYETSRDAAGLAAERAHLFFQFDTPGQVQVVELLVVTNQANHVVVAPADGQPVFSVKLPDGAVGLQFQDGELGGRFVQIAGGFGDTLPVQPAPALHQVLFAYNLPYEGKLPLSIEMPMPVASLVVAVPAEGVSLQSAQLQSTGARSVEGMDLNMYLGGALPAGGKLDLVLSGQPRPAGAAAPPDNTPLFLSIAVFVLVAAGGLAWLLGRRRLAAAAPRQTRPAPEPAPAQSPDALLDEIAALDDLNAAGELKDEAYHQRRAELLARLQAARHRDETNERSERSE